MPRVLERRHCTRRSSQDSLVGFLDSILCGLLLATALVALVGPSDSGGAVGKELLVRGSDGLELLLDGSDGSGENLAGGLVGSGTGLDLLGGGVVDKTLLDLTVLPGEQDELGFVHVESFNVQLELLLAGVRASVINGDTNSAAEAGAEAAGADLVKSETTAVPNLASVLASARGHNRSQLLERPGEHSLALVLSLVPTNELLLGLIKMDPDSELPVFTEMNVRDDVVVLYHC